MSHTQHANAARFTLPKAPQKAAEEMIRIIEAMLDIYSRECDCLHKADMRGFFAIHDEKADIHTRYEQGLQQMLKRKEEMKTVSATIKDQLRDLQTNFHAIANKNRDLLERMQKAVGRLNDTIRNATKEAVNKRTQGSYGASGSLHKPSARALSIGINETI